MAKHAKVRVVAKRYTPSKPTVGLLLQARADNEFQLLVERHGGKPVWINVSEDQYHAARPGGVFRTGKQRSWFWFRGLHDSPAMHNPATGAGEGWAAANLGGR